MQWGFYFDQSRCLGCKTCMLACKNWNELRRGDAKIHQLVLAGYETDEGAAELKSTYLDETGRTNYKEFGKYYMKENWRRVDTFDRGSVVIEEGNKLKSTFDRRYVSVACNHCDEPACVEACPAGVISKDLETGIVLVNSESCISCGKCQSACPWSAPQFYDDFSKYPSGDANAPKMTKCTLCYDRINTGRKPACVAACWNRALDAGPIDELRRDYGTLDKLEDFDPDVTKPNIVFKPK